MQMVLHQTHHTIGHFKAIFSYLRQSLEKSRGAQETLHLFPELFMSGYPLQDLCLQKPFYEQYLNHLSDFADWALHEWKASSRNSALIGGLHYEFGESGIPDKITNVIYDCRPGQPPQVVHVKNLLPNYDIFDEKKYFEPGENVGSIEWNGLHFGLLVCEDMWTSNVHRTDPVSQLQRLNQKKRLDGVVNLSASPYNLGKFEKRMARAQEISNALDCPFYYVNRVGGEDEILFDGGSFAVSNSKILGQAKSFVADEMSLPLEKNKTPPPNETRENISANTWDDLFNANLALAAESQYRIPQLDCFECDEIIRALGFGLKEYARKSGFKNFLVALSGGIDSALVTAIIHLIKDKDQSLECLYMPGLYSASESYEWSNQMCRNLAIPLSSLPIKFMHSTVKNAFRECFSSDLEGLADENIQSRLRGTLLYARSNQTGSLVVNTSNKSEIAVGYSTQYGDSVGAISLLGDLYKSEVFQLARYINKVHGSIIPEEIIERPPSAELRADQRDDQSLPPYDRLDAILEGLLSYRLGAADLAKIADPEEIRRVYQLYTRSEYKRRQFCPIVKIRAKSFGFGYRVPISKTMSLEKF